jgi:hypothetical protein
MQNLMENETIMVGTNKKVFYIITRVIKLVFLFRKGYSRLLVVICLEHCSEKCSVL